MYDKLIFIGQVQPQYRLPYILKSLKILRNALNGFIIAGVEDGEVLCQQCEKELEQESALWLAEATEDFKTEQMRGLVSD